VSWSELFRREWGAVTFVLTVIAGMIAVPIAFYFFHQAPGPVNVPSIPTPTPSVASAAGTSPSPSPTTSPKASPSP